MPETISFPRVYNKQNAAVFESRKAAIEKRKEEKRKASLSLKEKIEAQEIVLKVPSGEKGKLFGSVTNANIADALKSLGITVERKKIELPEHTLKALGTYTAKIKLYGDETAELKVVVKSDKEEEADAKAEEKKEEPAVEAAEEEVSSGEASEETAEEETSAEEETQSEESEEQEQ